MSAAVRTSIWPVLAMPNLAVIVLLWMFRVLQTAIVPRMPAALRASVTVGPAIKRPVQAVWTLMSAKQSALVAIQAVQFV